jgi:hypothetical protein
MTQQPFDVPLEKYNIEYVPVENKKTVYVLLNHRVAYLCWLDALRKDLIKSGAFLFHIDQHADFGVSSLALIEDHEKIGDDQTKELEDFIKNRLGLQNYEFIVLAMYRGVIGDAISIDKEDDHDRLFGDPKTPLYETTRRREFVDKKGRLHKFYLGGSSIRAITGRYGLLTDAWTHQDVQKIFNESVANRNLILDIDLDYFTYNDGEGQWALNDRDMDFILDSEGFRYVLTRAKVITVALEPFYCGNTTECRHILKKVSSSLKKYIGVEIEEVTIKKFESELAEQPSN